jgi:hypothetical protein
MQVKLQEKKKGVDSLAAKIAAVQKECNMIFDDVSPHHPVLQTLTRITLITLKLPPCKDINYAHPPLLASLTLCAGATGGRVLGQPVQVHGAHGWTWDGQDHHDARHHQALP